MAAAPLLLVPSPQYLTRYLSELVGRQTLWKECKFCFLVAFSHLNAPLAYVDF